MQHFIDWASGGPEPSGLLFHVPAACVRGPLPLWAVGGAGADPRGVSLAHCEPVGHHQVSGITHTSCRLFQVSEFYCRALGPAHIHQTPGGQAQACPEKRSSEPATLALTHVTSQGGRAFLLSLAVGSSGRAWDCEKVPGLHTGPPALGPLCPLRCPGVWGSCCCSPHAHDHWRTGPGWLHINLFLHQEASATTTTSENTFILISEGRKRRAHGTSFVVKNSVFLLKATSPYSLPKQPVWCVHSPTDAGGPGDLCSPAWSQASSLQPAGEEVIRALLLPVTGVLPSTEITLWEGQVIG